MVKFILGFIVALILASLLFGAFMYGQNQSKIQEATPTTGSVAVPTNAYVPTVPSSPNDTEGVATGTIMGKLCYPSEMIPAGQIEAKRVGDNMVFVQNYAGSQQGGGNTYSFPLEPGTYNVRYAPQGSSLYGYHTTVCLTGLETTCGDTNPRQMVPATIVGGQTVVGFDLCDFYYQPQNAPVF